MQSNEFTAGFIKTSGGVVHLEALPQIRAVDVSTEFGRLFHTGLVPGDLATERIVLAHEFTAPRLETPRFTVRLVAWWK